MDNIPVHTSRAAAHDGTGVKRKQSRKNVKPLAIAVAVILGVAVLVFFGLSLYRSSTSATIDGGKYQAVFFTNGQVYFGKLQTLNGDYMRLTDIFYLQAKSDSTDPSKNPQATTAEDVADVQLIKLGDEIHGPTDEMIINESQVLFFENLKSDGKVSQSIATYKKQ
jgi:hypothetical protein